MERKRSPRFDDATQRAALKKPVMLDAAETIEDLRVPPGNRLEKLQGDREGQHGIRADQQWRIRFRRTDAGPEGVAIKRRISADTALRLARCSGTSDRFRMNLQNRYDLEIERDRLGNDLRRTRPFAAA